MLFCAIEFARVLKICWFAPSSISSSSKASGAVKGKIGTVKKGRGTLMLGSRTLKQSYNSIMVFTTPFFLWEAALVIIYVITYIKLSGMAVRASHQLSSGVPPVLPR